MWKIHLILKHICVMMTISEATAKSERMLSCMKRLKTISDIANRINANTQIPRPRGT